MTSVRAQQQAELLSGCIVSPHVFESIEGYPDLSLPSLRRQATPTLLTLVSLFTIR
jgi:hypothetical protein